MKNKISYLVLGAFLMVGGMDSALAGQAYTSEYIKTQPFNAVHTYAHDFQVGALRAAAGPTAGGLADAHTAIGIGLNNAAFANSNALADVFGAGVLNGAGGGNIGAGQHVLSVGFRPGNFGAVVTNAQGRNLLNELSRDFYATFDMGKFTDDLLLDYVSWLGKNLKDDKLSGGDIVTIGDLNDSTKLLGVAERHFQEFLGQYNVKKIVKTHFKDLFEKKIGEAVRRSTNAPGVGLDEVMLSALIKNSHLCVYKAAGAWDQNMKDALVAAVNTVKALEFADEKDNPIAQIKQNLKDKSAAGVNAAGSRFKGVKTKAPAPANDPQPPVTLPAQDTVPVTFAGVTKQLTAAQKAEYDKLTGGRKLSYLKAIK